MRIVHGPDGVDAPLYVIPFDKRGTTTGPSTRDQLVEQSRGATDIFVFSHGWNNDWATATARYDDFVTAYLRLRTEQWSRPARHYVPVLAGVFWPSTALVAPWEQAPDIAAGGVADHGAGIGDLAAAMSTADAARFYALADRPHLNEADGRALVELVSAGLDADDEAPGPQDMRDSDQLMAAWRALSAAEGTAAERPSSQTGSMVDNDNDNDEDDDGTATGTPGPAGLGWGDLDPRKLLRLATVLLMKDRAGTVGTTGVADLLDRVNTAAPRARIHLVGHSYGAKVLLSALRAADHVPKVDSALLLQAAVSAYCFAPAGGVPGSGAEGGYHRVLGRTQQPILATFSRRDRALHDAFQWAARRARDLGEADVAAGEVPSRFAGLGGYGPQGLHCRVVDAVLPPAPYALADDGVGLIGLRADAVIAGHGDVVSPATAWMLLTQVMG